MYNVDTAQVYKVQGKQRQAARRCFSPDGKSEPNAWSWSCLLPHRATARCRNLESALRLVPKRCELSGLHETMAQSRTAPLIAML
jgi:hypothetical protein